MIALTWDALFSGFLGALGVLIVDRFFIHPEIKLLFNEGEGFHPVTKIKLKDPALSYTHSTRGKYLRVQIKNLGFLRFFSVTAKNCRPFMRDLKVKDEKGNVTSIGLDWIPLSFAFTDSEVMDIYSDAPVFVDIFHTIEAKDTELIPAKTFPLKDYDILRQSGDFEGIIVLIGENFRKREKKVRFKWEAGKFDSLNPLPILS